MTLNKYFNKILDREETEKEKAAREKRYAKYQKQKELMAQQQMNGGGRNDRKPQPKKKKQGGEENAAAPMKTDVWASGLMHVAVPMMKSTTNKEFCL